MGPGAVPVQSIDSLGSSSSYSESYSTSMAGMISSAHFVRIWLALVDTGAHTADEACIIADMECCPIFVTDAGPGMSS